MSWLDALFSGVQTIYVNGVPLTQEVGLNFASGATAVDNPGAGRTDVTITGASPTPPTGTGFAHVTSGAYDLASTNTFPSPIIQTPTISGQTIYLPTTTSPATYGATDSIVYMGQTTSSAHTSVQIGSNLPLPGTTGAPCTRGGLALDVEVEMISTTTAVGASFKLSWRWAVQTSGSPVAMGSLVTSLTTGTNSGSPPSSWAATLQLDGTSKYAQVVVTGDASLTVTVQALLQWKYTD